MAIWPDYKHHNTFDFFVCVFHNSTITLSKVYTRRTSDKAIILVSCLFDGLPKHSNIIVDKGLNLSDECTARCVYLSPQEEGCTSFIWKNSKMYTSRTTANSLGMPTEKYKNGATAKVRILVEKVILKIFKDIYNNF